MNILEKDIEEIVFQSNNEALQKRGLLIRGKKFQQVNLGDYGIADIVSVNITKNESWEIDVQVIELKKDLIDVNTLTQAARYRKGIRKFINKYLKIKKPINFELILIGKKVQLNGDFIYALEALSNVRAYTYSLSLEDGICFNREIGYEITNAYIPAACEFDLFLLKDMIKDIVNPSM